MSFQATFVAGAGVAGALGGGGGGAPAGAWAPPHDNDEPPIKTPARIANIRVALNVMSFSWVVARACGTGDPYDT